MTSKHFRAGVIGAVGSTRIAINAIAKSDLELVGIAGFEPSDTSNVSGHRQFREVAEELGVDYIPFQSVNHADVVDKVKSWRLDFLFVVGLSQLVDNTLLKAARRGCIGYHPTALPYGRGRAPVAWLVLQKAPAASTLFAIEPGADTGGILAQRHFVVGPRMDAADVQKECHRTLEEAMSELLPRLARGWWSPREQDDSLATYLGKRDWFDGLIDWERPAIDVDGVIRAAAPPHPGAYCYHNGRRIRVLHSQGVVPNSPHIGIPGKVLSLANGVVDVQCNPGVIRIQGVVDESGPAHIRVGSLLRTRIEDEIYDLQQRVDELTRMVEALTNQLESHRPTDQ